MNTLTLTGDFSVLTRLEKEELPFALARALQDVGQVGKKALNEELTSSFASPTEFTQKGAFGTRVEKGETVVYVGVKDRQADYLDAEFFGGARKQRPYESRLKTKNGSKFLLPTEFTPKDRFGNVPPKVLKQILKDAQSNANGYYISGKTVRYRATGEKASNPLFVILDNDPSYQKKISLESTEKAIVEAWPDAFRKRLDQGVANPKRK